MKHAKRVGKVSFLFGIGLFAWPVLLGLWLSRHAHRKIEHPILRYLAISAIMLPSLTVGKVWAASVTSSSHPTPTSRQVEIRTEKKIITETLAVPFSEQKTNDPALAAGQEVVKQTGKDGIKTVSFEVTLTQGQETSRVQITEQLNTPPTSKITSVGTKPVAAQPVLAPSTLKPANSSTSTARTAQPPPPPTATAQSNNCDPNYTPCVPIASDVDCLGGGGNGPASVKGPVHVIGKDIYALDKDHNGIGCEN